MCHSQGELCRQAPVECQAGKACWSVDGDELWEQDVDGLLGYPLGIHYPEVASTQTFYLFNHNSRQLEVRGEEVDV